MKIKKKTKQKKTAPLESTVFLNVSWKIEITIILYKKMGFRIIQVVQFLHMTLFTSARKFWRQRHSVHVYELLVRVKVNNSVKKCGCSSLMYM